LVLKIGLKLLIIRRFGLLILTEVSKIIIKMLGRSGRQKGIWEGSMKFMIELIPFGEIFAALDE
jgi:hypothetical protein